MNTERVFEDGEERRVFVWFGLRLWIPDGVFRFVVRDIIGAESDLGVENLRGSGTIAGETSRAYVVLSVF